MSEPPKQTEDTLEDQSSVKELISPSLFRLTAGLPRRELKLMVEEAKACEAALEKEIEALENPNDNKAAVDVMLSTELTSADRYHTVSALLGRLREPLATPLPPNSSLIPQTTAQETSQKDLLQQTSALLELETNPEYTKIHDSPSTLLSVWKRISSHRTAAVFRRPVNAREAPGYTERIRFPMDLLLIKKMISANMICTLQELHQRIFLICHNCVKYNGRESDYGVVTREFEAHADECILAAVNHTGGTGSRTTTPTAADNPGVSNAKQSTKETAKDVKQKDGEKKADVK